LIWDELAVALAPECFQVHSEFYSWFALASCDEINDNVTQTHLREREETAI